MSPVPPGDRADSTAPADPPESPAPADPSEPPETRTPPEPPDPPEGYPWSALAAATSVLVDEGTRRLIPAHAGGIGAARLAAAPVGTEPTLADLLARLGAVPLAERTLVVAVGSNAAPRVIRRKYAGGGLRGPLVTPFARCTVSGLAVGCSAHVSRRGYVPAAPFASPGAVTELVAAWFDPEQLEIVDRTEPNYDRLELTADRFPLALATGERPERFAVYASRWGVLADPRTGAPRPFEDRQERILAWLDAQVGGGVFAGPAAQVCARLGADLVLRERAQAALAGPLTVSAGLPGDHEAFTSR